MSEIMSCLFVLVMKFSRNSLEWPDVINLLKMFISEDKFKENSNIIDGV